MRDLFWRLSLTFLVLAGLGAVGLDLGLGAPDAWGDTLPGETPQVCVDALLRAARQGDAEASAALWRQNPRLGPAFGVRRASVWEHLLSYGASLTYQIETVEWWTTRSEPAVVADPDEADGARLWVTLSGEGGPDGLYVFDLLAPAGDQEAAEDHPIPRWEIVDVYPAGDSPMAFGWQAGTGQP
jgi:hypothetical protein